MMNDKEMEEMMSQSIPPPPQPQDPRSVKQGEIPKKISARMAMLTNGEFEPDKVQEIVAILKGKTLEEGSYILKQVLNWMKTNARI